MVEVYAYANGGVFSDGSDTIRANNTTADTLITTPTREGYKFLGWSNHSDSTTGLLLDSAIDEAYNESPSANIYYIYAVWKANVTPGIYMKISGAWKRVREYSS